MAQLYDSEKVRSAAEAVRVLSVMLSEATAQPVRRAISSAEPLRGAAADALRERLEEFQTSASRLTSQMQRINEALDRYASVLEAVGKDLKSQM